MIKFFRKIRRKLLLKGNIGAYLKYAIGEIILVVIGILIALSINNWNENNKRKANEIRVANELYVELNENEASLKSQLKFWETRDKKILEVIALTEQKPTTITNRAFDSLMIYVIGYYNLKLKQSKFQRILSSESFEFKTSPSLITDMLDLNDNYSTLMVYYKLIETHDINFLQPYLMDHYAFLNFEHFFDSKIMESPVPIDCNILIADLKFQNIITSARGNNAPFVLILKKTIKDIGVLKTKLETVYPSITN